MPGRGNRQVINIGRLADAISQSIVDIAEVDFSSYDKKSLFAAVTRVLKEKFVKKTLYRYQKIWRDNTDGIRNRVKELLDLRYGIPENVLDDVASPTVQDRARSVHGPPQNLLDRTIEKISHDLITTGDLTYEAVEISAGSTGISKTLTNRITDKITNEFLPIAEVTTEPLDIRDGSFNGRDTTNLSSSTINECPHDHSPIADVSAECEEVSAGSINGTSQKVIEVQQRESRTQNLSPPLETNELRNWNTPKSSRKTINNEENEADIGTVGSAVSNNGVENESGTECDDSTSSRSSCFFDDPESSSDDSDAGYVEPPKSPSIRKKFTEALGCYEIPSTILQKEDSEMDHHELRCTLAKVMLEDLGYPCPLAFYGDVRRNKNGTFVYYANCRYVSHVQSFRFAVTNFEKLIACIYFSSTKCDEIVHNGPKIFCTLRGKERIEVQDKLKHMAARTLQLQTAKEIDEEIAKDGHMQKLRRLAVYNKAKSEEKCKNDTILCSNDLSDLFQQHVLDMATSDPFIRYTGIPLHAHMYSEEQLNIVGTEDIIAYFDATGSVVRKPKDVKCKRIMYYAVVINKNGSIVPVAGSVNSEQHVPAISSLIKGFRYFVLAKHGRWPLFRVVVTDWSWAIINSIMNDWNLMSVTDYLKEAYTCVMNNTNLRSDLVVAHSCCAHFQKRVSSNIHQNFPKYVRHKAFILECMGLMIHCSDITSLDEVFEGFMTVLVTTSSVQAAASTANLHQLHVRITKAPFGSDETEDVLRDKEIVDLDPIDSEDGRVSTDSPFFNHYFAKLTKIKETIIHSAGSNEYCMPEIADFITKRFMPFVPMWSALLLKKVAPNVSRLSNANVECHFNLVKHQLLDGEVDLKVGRFINKLKEYKAQLCKEIAIGVPLKGRRNRRSRQLVVRSNADSPNNPLVTDMWERKRKAQISHLEGALLGKLVKKRKTIRSSSVPSKIKTERTVPSKKATKLDASTPRGEVVTPNSSTSSKQEQSLANRSQNLPIKRVNIPHTSTPKEKVVILTDLIASEHEQSLLDRSDCSTHTNALANGLFRDVDYYMATKQPQFAVGRYASSVCAPVIAFDEFQLFSTEYQSLCGNSWLDGDVIDCLSVAKMASWRNTTYVPTKYTSHLLGNFSNTKKPDTWRMFNIEWPTSGRILMPYLYKGHWCLLVVDIDEQSLMHLDPQSISSPDRTRAFKMFKKYVADFSKKHPDRLSGIKWYEKTCRTARPMQHDGHNCGLYVLHFLESIGTNQKFNLKFDPISYRMEVAEALLTLSGDMKDTCQYCFREWKDLVMCSTCRRWAHQSCIELAVGTKKTIDEWNDPSSKYRCPLCSRGIRHWMLY